MQRYEVLYIDSSRSCSNETVILDILLVQGDPGPIGFQGPPGIKGQKVSSCFIFHTGFPASNAQSSEVRLVVKGTESE